MSTLHLIDASIYVFRAYYSMPPTFHDQEGNLVHALYGFTNFLLDIRSKGMTHASVAFDESLNTCFRNEIFPAYKANRDEADENLKYQLRRCQEITSLLGFHSLCFERFEADDIIGSLCKQVGADRDLVIVTRDKDLGQLLRSNDVLWDFANNDFMGPAEVETKFGVPPERIADFLALAGDSVDNIPGAPGIGAKTAAQLLQEFGTLDNLISDPDQVLNSSIRGSKRVAKILSDNQAELVLYRRITEIFCDIEMDVGIDDLKLGLPEPSVKEFCETMNFSERLKSRIQQLSVS